MRSKALKNKLAEQSSQDIERFMDPNARVRPFMSTSKAKGLRAARDAMKKAGEDFSTGLDDYNMANIISNDEIAANIAKDRTPPPAPTPAPPSSDVDIQQAMQTGIKLDKLTRKQSGASRTARAARPDMAKIAQDFANRNYNFQLMTGYDPETLKPSFDIPTSDEITKNIESAKKAISDRVSLQTTGAPRGSQRGTGELSRLQARQAGATPVTQAQVDHSGAFDRRSKSAAAQGKGAVSGLDFSTAVRPASKDGSKGAADTPTVVTPGTEAEPPRGFRGMAQDAATVVQNAYQNMRDQQAADFAQAAALSNASSERQDVKDYVDTMKGMNRSSVFPQLTPAEIGSNVAQDAALVAPIPSVGVLGNLVRRIFGKRPTPSIKPTSTPDPVVGRPGTGSVSNDPPFGTPRVGADEAEGFITGRPVPKTPADKPDPVLPAPGSAPVDATGPIVGTPGGRVSDILDRARIANDPIVGTPGAKPYVARAADNPYSSGGTARAYDTAVQQSSRVAPPPSSAATSKSNSTAITNILKGTQVDPIPSSFAQVGTRRTQKVAAPEFKEPKNFTQLQKLYNKGEITPQQYEMYKNRFLTAESKLEYIRTMFREA